MKNAKNRVQKITGEDVAFCYIVESIFEGCQGKSTMGRRL
jgi:hypothetical protein